MPIQAVVFDLDHTLWSVGPAPDWDGVSHLQAARLAPELARLGREQLDLGEFVRSFWADFGAAHSPADTALDEPRWLQGPTAIRNALAACGVECGDADGERLWEALNSVPLHYFSVRPFPDAASTVGALRATGYRLAIVTGRPLAASIIARELRDQAIRDVFEAIVTSGEVGYRKPHPLVFESALAKLGVPAEEAIVVGDSYEDDIVPAARLGMVTVLKLNDREPDRRRVLARYQVPSLAALLRLEVFDS